MRNTGKVNRRPVPAFMPRRASRPAPRPIAFASRRPHRHLAPAWHPAPPRPFNLSDRFLEGLADHFGEKAWTARDVARAGFVGSGRTRALGYALARAAAHPPAAGLVIVRLEADCRDGRLWQVVRMPRW